jgi:SAM-dependent methyltransferase
MMRSEAGDPYNQLGTGTATLELLEGAVHYNAWLTSKLVPFLGENNLELGAGHGTLTALVARGRTVVASEPSATGRSVLLQRFASNPQVTSVIADLAGLPKSATFDCVYSANVLEHVADDVALIKQAAEVLRPGGHFVALVPACGWLYSSFDAAVGHHRRYGSADRIRLSAELARGSTPLQLVAYRYFNPIGAVGWFFRMRMFKHAQIPTADVERFDRLVPLLRHLDRVPVGFGQNLLISLVKCR